MIGPALAGIVIGLGSFELAFAINTLSFFAVIVAIAPMHLPPPSPHGHETIRKSIAGGLRFVRGDSGLRAVVTYLALNSLLAAPFIALIPAVALKVFDEEKLGTSLFVTAQGVGAVVMALHARRAEPPGGVAARRAGRARGAAVRARALRDRAHARARDRRDLLRRRRVPRLPVGLQHRRAAARTAGAARAA